MTINAEIYALETSRWLFMCLQVYLILVSGTHLWYLYLGKGAYDRKLINLVKRTCNLMCHVMTFYNHQVLLLFQCHSDNTLCSYAKVWAMIISIPVLDSWNIQYLSNITVSDVKALTNASQPLLSRGENRNLAGFCTLPNRPSAQGLNPDQILCDRYSGSLHFKPI